MGEGNECNRDLSPTTTLKSDKAAFGVGVSTADSAESGIFLFRHGLGNSHNLDDRFTIHLGWGMGQVFQDAQTFTLAINCQRNCFGIAYSEWRRMDCVGIRGAGLSPL